MDDARSAALDWIRLARMDSSSANFLRDMHPAPVEVICFHCQQAVEKLLKAILVLHSVAPPRTHDLDSLCALCAEHGTDVSDMQDDCTLLAAYAVQSRYPIEQQLEERDMLAALTAMERIEASIMAQEVGLNLEHFDCLEENLGMQMQ